MNYHDELKKLAGISKGNTNTSKQVKKIDTTKIKSRIDNVVNKEKVLMEEGTKFLIELSKQSKQNINNNLSERKQLSESYMTISVADKNLLKQLINDGCKNKNKESIKEKIVDKMLGLMEKYSVRSPNDLLVKFGASVIHDKSGIKVKW